MYLESGGRKNYVEIEPDIAFLNYSIGVVIEEIVEEDNPISTNSSVSKPPEVIDNSKIADAYKKSINSESLQGLRDDPEAIRSACFNQNFLT